MLTSAVITVVQMVSVNIYFIVHVGNIAKKITYKTYNDIITQDNACPYAINGAKHN